MSPSNLSRPLEAVLNIMNENWPTRGKTANTLRFEPSRIF